MFNAKTGEYAKICPVATSVASATEDSKAFSVKPKSINVDTFIAETEGQSLSGGNFKCVCKPGFSGRFCQTCKFLHVVTQNPKSNYDRNKKTVSYRKKIITLKI